MNLPECRCSQGGLTGCSSPSPEVQGHMTARGTLIVAETPSLADSIDDLLRADGIFADTVPDCYSGLGGWVRRHGHSPYLLICASNAHRCETVRRWFSGEVGAMELVVVGSRDPGLRSRGNLHLVSLPLSPVKFLEMVHALSGDAGKCDDAGPEASRGESPVGAAHDRTPGPRLVLPISQGSRAIALENLPPPSVPGTDDA